LAAQVCLSDSSGGRFAVRAELLLPLFASATGQAFAQSSPLTQRGLAIVLRTRTVPRNMAQCLLGREGQAMHALFRGVSVIPVLTIEREADALRSPALCTRAASASSR
jgi:hypothetical protein